VAAGAGTGVAEQAERDVRDVEARLEQQVEVVAVEQADVVAALLVYALAGRWGGLRGDGCEQQSAGERGYGDDGGAEEAHQVPFNGDRGVKCLAGYSRIRPEF